jgi:hypothetical protein
MELVGHAFNDVNGNGFQDTGPPPEPDLPGLVIKITDGLSSTLLDQCVTDASGNYDRFVTPIGPITAVEIFPSLELVPLTATYVPYVSGGLGSATFRFQSIQCQRVVSHWVAKVCWVPNRGVRVTYKHHKLSYFTCLYPGTVYQDYLDFLTAPSKGRWARQNYFRRPYIPLPPSP